MIGAALENGRSWLLRQSFTPIKENGVSMVEISTNFVTRFNGWNIFLEFLYSELTYIDDVISMRWW